MKRSNVELSKRIFLDRLTTDAQPLMQPAHIDAGPGDEYEYAGTYDPYNFGIGADCSGSNGIFIGAALLGGQDMSWGREFSTETFPGPFGNRFRQVGRDEFLSSPAVIRVMIMHGGGGPNSHMACIIDGIHMESNGSHGTVGGPISVPNNTINPQTSSIWNDWWISVEPIEEDTTWRQAMSYPRGVDYAGGRISAADLKAAGISFVCRYVNSGGAQLPGKQLLPSEFTDLVNSDMPLVFNYETTADFTLAGHDLGHTAAQQALDYIRSMPGMPLDWLPVVYFSVDFDEAPGQDAAIFAFCDGATEVLGTEPGGRRRTGLYGAYWICKRARDAGKIGYIWQTEAWSGGNIDSRVDIMQRNALGYQTIGGVQCDINEAHTEWFGQFVKTDPAVNPPVPQPPTPSGDAFVDWVTTASEIDLLRYAVAQLGAGYPDWPNNDRTTMRDKLFSLVPKVPTSKDET